MIHKLVIDLLREKYPEFAGAASDLWDVLPAAQGVSVLLLDGTFRPIRCGDSFARQLLHSWQIEARA